MRAFFLLFVLAASFGLQEGRAQIAPCTIRQFTGAAPGQPTTLPFLLALFNPKCGTASETIETIKQATADYGAKSVHVVSVIQDVRFLTTYQASNQYSGTLYYLDSAAYGTGREKSERFIQEAAEVWNIPHTEFSYIVVNRNQQAVYAGDDLSEALTVFGKEQDVRKPVKPVTP